MWHVLTEFSHHWIALQGPSLICGGWGAVSQPAFRDSLHRLNHPNERPITRQFDIRET